MEPDTTTIEEQLDYSTALSELEGILADLNDERLNVDLLASKVERASTLITFCRTRITAARTQVSQIVADLDLLGEDELDTSET